MLSFDMKPYLRGRGAGNTPSGDTVYYSISSEKFLQLNKVHVKIISHVEKGS